MSDTSNLHNEGGMRPLQLFQYFRLLPDTTGSGMLPLVFWDHAVSSSTGALELHEPRDKSGYILPTTVSAHINAPGAEGYALEGTLWSSQTIFTFPRNVLNYTGTASDLLLTWEPGRDYKAWAELHVQNAFIVGSGSLMDPVRFMARQHVHITSEFHAGGDSEVHLFTDETFPDCSNPFLGMNPDEPKNSSTQKQLGHSNFSTGSIEIRFTDDKPILKIFPNPCQNYFILNCSENGVVTILNSLGSIVHQVTKNSNDITIYSDNWSLGHYTVNLLSNDGTMFTSQINKVR